MKCSGFLVMSCVYWTFHLQPLRQKSLIFATSPYTGEAFYGRSWSEGAFGCGIEKHRRGEHRLAAKSSQTKQADGQWPPLRVRCCCRQRRSVPTASLFTTPPHKNYSKNPLVLTVCFWYNKGKKMAYKPSEIPATLPTRFIPAHRKETAP